MRRTPTAGGPRGRVRGADWSGAKLGNCSKHGAIRRALGRGVYGPRSSLSAFDSLLFARLHRTGCAPYNGSRISGEPLLKSFGEGTQFAAKPHEPPFPEREARRN
jgi:hypothetical protein